METHFYVGVTVIIYTLIIILNIMSMYFYLSYLSCKCITN